MSEDIGAGMEPGTGGDPPPWPRERSQSLAEYEVFGVRRDRAISPRDDSRHDFHIVEAPDGVTVVALTASSEIVLVKQFRHPRREVTLETPSGVIDPGERVAEAAVRELREETGFQGDPAIELGLLELNPSWQTTRVHVVLVRNARRSAPLDPDPGEDIRVVTIPLSELTERILKGEIRSATAVAAAALFQWQAGSRSGASEGPDLGGDLQGPTASD